MIIEKTYDFDDVLIAPINSTVSSRDEVDISVKFPDFTLKFPLIASPMVGVVDGQFAKKLSGLGGLAIFHRFYETEEDLFLDVRSNMQNGDNFGLSIKINSDNGIGKYLDLNPRILLVDTANGYNPELYKYCEQIKNYIRNNGFKTLLMAGNVVTELGFKALVDAGCDIIRVGIGGGSPCSTRNQTGIGIPNISALANCARGITDSYIIIDGGLKNSGDFVKSVVAGADLGMAGRLFAECYEAPNKGVLYGMASRTHMNKTGTSIKSVEGIDTKITKKHSLKQFVTEFSYGIKSAGTYLNARSLNEICYNGRFVEVSDTAIKKGI